MNEPHPFAFLEPATGPGENAAPAAPEPAAADPKLAKSVFAEDPDDPEVAEELQRTRDRKGRFKAEEDASLNRILDLHEGKEDEGEGDEDADTPKQAGAGQPKPPGKGAAKGKAAPALSSEQEESYATALAALRRDGLPETIISKLSPAEVIESGLHRKKNQDDVDAAFADLKRLRASGNAEPGTQGTNSKSDAAAHTEPSRADDLEAKFQTVSDLYGPDAAKALMDVVRPLKAENAERSQREQMLTEGVYAILHESVRESLLSREFPALEDDALYEKVREKAETLLATGSYKDAGKTPLARLKAAYRDAVKLVPDAAHGSQERNLTRAREQLHGQPARNGRKADKSRKVSQSDREDAVIAALEDGRSVEDARRVWRGG